MMNNGSAFMNNHNAFSIRFWDKLAAKYARKPVPDEAIYEQKIQITQEFLDTDDEVFEFGCGTGSTALRHAPKVKQLLATDISPAMIGIAKQQAEASGTNNVSFATGEVGDFKLESCSKDAVLGLNIMHLLPSPTVALHEVHRILKNDGIFVSSTPLLKNEPLFVRWILRIMQALRHAPYISLLNKDEYLKQVTDAGFAVVRAWMPTKTSIFLIVRKAEVHTCCEKNKAS